MNDPHVVALHYKVTHRPEFDYSAAPTLCVSTPGFDIRIEAGKACFSMKAHHATEREACAAVDAYIRTWELDAALQNGPNRFGLSFVRAEIVERNPPPGDAPSHEVHERIALADSWSWKLTPSQYPSPPSTGLARTPDVESMFTRHVGYCEGREPLASMAYFCLSVLEASSGEHRGRRKAAATKYCIDEEVLANLARLCSAKGGAGARKAEGLGHELSSQEEQFLNLAVRALIRRAAEVAHNPRAALKRITLRDLPTI